MSEVPSEDLSGVAETLLITLYLRAMETQRPDALIKDEKAAALVRQMSYDFDRIRQIPLSEANKIVIILRNREFDRCTRNFLKSHRDAVVVHIGCGLDARFERVDNGLVEWYDLDFPEVIELRRRLFGGEAERHHLLGCSVLDDTWMELPGAPRRRPILFLAEGVFMYLEAAQVRSLVLALRGRFPGAELVFDAFSPLHVLWSKFQLSVTRFGDLLRWGLWHGEEIERWGTGICLLDEWGFFDDPTPRLAPIRWMRGIEAVARTLRIYHFRLG